MRVIKSGDGRKGWARECKCTGRGNGNGGCGAVLLVEKGDLFQTQRNCMAETDYFVTFECPECGVLTDLPEGAAPFDAARLPTHAEWKKSKASSEGK